MTNNSGTENNEQVDATQDGSDQVQRDEPIAADRTVSPELEAAINDAEAAEAEGPEAGIKSWEKAWSVDPGHPVVLDALDRLHADANSRDKLADFLKRMGRRIDDTARFLETHMLLARVYDEELQQDAQAVATYQAILRQKKDYLPALNAASDKFEAMERWPDLVKVLKTKGEILTDKDEQIELWLKVANLFTSQFSNQAEAIKAFEAVIELDPANPMAVDFLKEMYEKRRDWKKMIHMMQLQADVMEDGPDKLDALVDIAKLAAERIKKPDVCIEHWEAVLALEPEHPDALQDLAHFYERDKSWDKLASVLSALVTVSVDDDERAKLLQKLGMVWGDKIGNMEQAQETWKQLLALSPDDRRAQEHLKKCYLEMQAFDELELFYAESEKWDELIRILEKEAHKEEADESARIGLFFKIAQLYREKKQRMDKCANAYESVLEIDKNNADAAEALIPIYEESGDTPERLADALEVRLAHVENQDDRVALLRRISRLAETEIKDTERAFSGFLKIFEARPLSEDAQEDLERTAGMAGKWERVVDAYRAAYEDAAQDDKIALRIRMARVLSEELGKPDEALAHFDEILAQDPKNERAIFALERIYAQMGRFEELLDIYAKRIEVAEDDSERKEIYYNQALLFEEEIDDVAKAVAIYQKIVDMSGDEQRALAALDRIYGREEKWEQLADVLERELALGEGEVAEEIDLKFRLGQVSQAQLGDSQKALVCFRDVVNLDPGNEKGIGALEALLETDDVKQEAARLLSPLYEAMEEWEKYVSVNALYVDCNDDAVENYELLSRLGEVSQEQLNSPERAFAFYSRAFVIDPNNDALSRLEEMATILDLWEDFSNLLQEGASVTDDPDNQRKLWLKAAQILDTQLEKIDAAVHAYREVLKVDPECSEAMSALEGIFSRDERFDDLVDLLAAKVDMLTDADERQSVYRQMAGIYEEMLEKPESAVACMKEILSIDPTNMEALKTLDRLFLLLEMWTDLADNLQQQLAVESDVDSLVDLKLRLAKLQESELKDVSAAIEIYREIFDLDPGNDVATEALERLVSVEEYRMEIAQILEPIYRDTGNWEKLVGVLEIMIAEEETLDRQIDLLHEIAGLYETTGDEPEKAFETYSRALKKDPEQEKTQAELERMAQMLALDEELAVLYSGLVEDLDDADLKACYYLKIAGIYEEKLQDTEKAIANYKAVLGIDPLHLEAASALEKAFQITENYEELSLIYLKKVEMIDSIDDQKELLFKAGQIYEEILENADKAIEVYSQVLELDEDELRAITQLEGLFLRLERWEDLQSVYNRKVDLLDDIDEKKEVLYVLGAMYERELDDSAKAINTYQRVIEFDPDDMQAIGRLDMLYSAAEAWPDLLSILEREIELVQDVDEAMSFKYRVAELYVRHLDDVTQAIEYLKDILTVSPDHALSIGLLEELVKGTHEPLLAAEVLEPIYRDLGQWRELVNVLEIKISHIDDEWQQVELFHQAAEILQSEIHLDSPAEAFNMYSRALEIDPLNENTLQHLENMAQISDRFGDFARTLDGLLDNTQEDEVIVSLGLLAARLYEEQIDDIDAAIERNRRVLSVDDLNRDAILRLDKLFQLAERWQDLSGVLKQEISVLDTPDERLDVQFRLGQLYQNELEDVEQAIEMYNDILAADPEHEQAVSALESLFMEGHKTADIVHILEPLYQMQAEWAKLAALWGHFLESVEVVEERIALQHRIAETVEEKLLDPVEAFNWYCRAFAEEPTDERSGQEVERLAAATESWGELADHYEQMAAQQQNDDVKNGVIKRLARVCLEEMQDMERAEKAFRASLAIDKGDLDVLKSLDGIYTQYMEWQKLVDILSQLVSVNPVPAEQIDCCFRMGDVLETQLDDIEQATSVFLKIVDDLDPGNQDALLRLEMIYANREEWDNLYGIYGKMRDNASNDAEEADLLAKQATIAAECKEDVSLAIELWEDVLGILGEDVKALDALGELYSRQEKWDDLVDVLERAVAVATDDDDRINLYSQLGTVWGECLERDRNALENWQNVLSIDYQNIPALLAIAKIYEANQEWEDLIDALERIVEIGASAFEIEAYKGYFFKLAKILSDVVERPFDSIAVWQKALEVDPSDMSIVLALESLYYEQEMWEDLVRILGQKAELLEGEEQIEIWMQQARIIETELQTPLLAKEPYVRILAVSPLHDHAFERCIEILKEEEAWEDLIQLYSVRLENAVDIDARIGLLHDAAEVYEAKLNQVDNAFQVMQHAFELDYANDVTGDHLERLASEAGKWQELFGLCNQILASSQDAKTQIDLCLKIGKWYAGQGNPEYAIQYFQRVLTLDSGNAKALRLMGELYRGAKQWNELVEVLGRAADCEEDVDIKKEIYMDLGEIHMEYMQDFPEAKKAYQNALDLDPTLERALKALERMFRASENWEELVPVLQRKLNVLEDTDTIAIIGTRQRIAQIYADNLEEYAKAIEAYKKNIELDPGHLPSLKGLEALYDGQKMWHDLLDILEAQLECVATDGERISLLLRIADMLEKEFRKPREAIDRLVEVTEIDVNEISAYEALERLYRAAGQWNDVVETYEKHVDAVTEKAAKVPLYMAMGSVLSRELDETDRAMDVYKDVLDIEPENREALDCLAKLQVAVEDWMAAKDSLDRLALLVDEPDKKVDLYTRLGELSERQLMDRGAAVENLRMALDIEPQHLPALKALKEIHIAEAEWQAACDVLESEQEFTENRRNKSRLQYELGRLYRDKLDEQGTAVSWFEKALESDRDNQEAALPLVDVYIDEARWGDAEPILDMLVRNSGKRSTDEKIALNRKLGRVCDQSGNLDKALKAYQSAYEQNTQDLSLLLSYADVLYRSEEWNQAFKLYQMVLVHHRDEQNDNEIVEIFYRLGTIKANLNERRKALNMFDKALEINGTHVPTLEAVVAIQEAHKNFEQVIHYKKQIIEAVEDAEVQFALWEQIGDIWQGKLKNPKKAIAAYQEASGLKPDNRPILHKLIPLYQMTKQWQDVVDMVGRVCEMETDQEKLARYYYTMAVINRDEIKNAEEAVRCFNAALDNSLENLKAFEAIDRILTQQKNWKELERSYRKMIHRVAGKDKTDLEVNLWHFLGEIYRTRMGQFEAAAEAFKMASKLEPDNITRYEILAELYSKMPGKLEDAVAQHQALIAQSPYKVDSYKALRRLYFEHRQYDKAWCLCATLSFLKKADPEEQQFFEQYRIRGTARAQSRLDDPTWIKDLFHRDESVYMGKIFSLVTNAVRSYKVQPIKNFGLKKGQKRPHNDTLTFSKTFFYAAQVLNLPVVPDLYLQEDRPGGLNFAITEPIASACGSSLLSGYSPQELLFLVTRHLTYYRPEHYIRWIMPSHSELKALMLAAIKMGNPDAPVPDSPELTQLRQQLASQIEPVQLEALRKLVVKFLKSGEQADLKKWIRSLELTACRSGFLLSNDIETAARMIQADTAPVDDTPPKEKIKELVLFSVSEEYFRLRERLGIVIGA